MTIRDFSPPRPAYPVRVFAELDPNLSRWLWLVKWFLAIPHYLVLIALWLAFAVSSVIAFFAIVLTGRFPRTLFDFNVGVMRWTWRVTYYAYGALGTDRYPPFTLSDVPDFPAHLEVDYPERLSRGLVLVKWWLLALPHYLVVAFFVSGGIFAAGEASDHPEPFLLSGGLVGLLVLIAGVTLLFTGRYPRAIFDLIIGMQRWALRVAGYAALMTDEYPPFRLDLGGTADDGAPTGPTPAPATPGAQVRSRTIERSPSSDPPVGAARRATVIMVAGIISLVLAAVLAFGAAAVWTAKKTLADDDGFFTAPTASCRVDSYAITSESLRLDFSGPGSLTPSSVLGDGRVTARSADGSAVFVGIADSRSVDTYLEGVGRSTMLPERRFGDERLPVCETSGGRAPSTAPATMPIWTTYAQGSGSQTITWPFRQGDWTVVIMNADGSRGLDVAVDAGATFPAVGLVITILMFATGFFLLLGLAMVIGSASGRRSVRLARATGIDGPAG